MAEETSTASPSVPPASSNEDIDPPIVLSDRNPSDAKADAGKPVAEGGSKGNKASEVAETNGETESAAPGTTPATVPQSEDTEMKDSGSAPEVANAPPVAPTNGTPAPSKKASNGSSKRKSSGVPEHKTKKLNKKKSRPITILNAQPGEYYFARMKGHPPWPSIICDEQMLPQSLLDTRPVTTRLPDGTFKKPEYADGGKRAHERTYPIMFLHTNEFAWMPNTELTPLDLESVTKPVEKGKSKVLLAAYEKAAEQNSLAHFKEMLVDHQKALQEDQEAQAELEAKRAAKAKRKSAEASAKAVDADDMDVDNEIDEPKPKSKKRKKEPDSDAGDEKPAKTPKTSTKLKLSTPKTPVSEQPSKRRASKPKTKAVAKDHDSEEELAVDSPKVEQTPAAAKEIKEKKVLFYRHKLQRGFLARDTAPKEDEMEVMSNYVTELENFGDIEGSIIRATKIHKVLKAMIKLPSIPLDETYELKSRAHNLLSKWNEILLNDPHAGSAADKEDSKTDPTPAKTNGEPRNAGKDSEKEAVRDDTVLEEQSSEVLERKIGTATEGDKETSEDEGKGPEQAESDDSGKGDEPEIDSAPSKEYKPAKEAVEASA